MTDNDSPESGQKKSTVRMRQSIKHLPALLDGVSGELVPTPTRRTKVNLHSVASVRREMSKIYRGCKNGDIPTHEGSKLCYMLQLIADLLVNENLEGRLAALEKTMGER
jgi:hypothetical protein